MLAAVRTVSVAFVLLPSCAYVVGCSRSVDDPAAGDPSQTDLPGDGDGDGDGGGDSSAVGSLRFFGNGGLYDDRVLMRLDDPETNEPGPRLDVGNTDFSLEFWIRPDSAANGNGAIDCGATNDWVYTNIIIDRDRHSYPPSFGVGIADGALVWAVQGAPDNPYSLCGSTNVLDGDWHFVVVQRRRSDGFLWLFVDGVLDASVDGPDGDISYPDDGVPTDECPGGSCAYSDPFLCLGAEKHGYEAILYSGWLAELRVSTTLRYTSDFPPPAAPFEVDAHTVGLYHFGEGGGLVVGDAVVGGTDGEIQRGGDPEGPQWSTDTPF